MAILLFVEGQIGALGLALCSMRNPFGRFTLASFKEGGTPEIFLIAAFCGGILGGSGNAGSVKNREVKIGLIALG